MCYKNIFDYLIGLLVPAGSADRDLGTETSTAAVTDPEAASVTIATGLVRRSDQATMSRRHRRLTVIVRRANENGANALNANAAIANEEIESAANANAVNVIASTPVVAVVTRGRHTLAGRTRSDVGRASHFSLSCQMVSQFLILV